MNWIGTFPQWLSFIALVWLVHLQQLPTKIELPSNPSDVVTAPREVKVVNFPSALQLPLIPVEIMGLPLVRSIVETEASKPLHITVDTREPLPIDLTSLAGKSLSISPTGNLRLPKPQFYEAETISHSFQDVGLSVDVKNIRR